MSDTSIYGLTEGRLLRTQLDSLKWQELRSPTYSGSWSKLQSISVGTDYIWAMVGGVGPTGAWKCKLPCEIARYGTGNDWGSVDLVKAGAVQITSVAVGDTEVWAIDDNGGLYVRPVDGSGSWESRQAPTGVNQVSVGKTDIWMIGGGIMYRCPRPCTSVDAWQNVAGFQKGVGASRISVFWGSA